MEDLCAFSYPRSGKVILLADGPEALVFSGANDGPIWKQFCQDVVVGIGSTHSEVVTLEASGRLVRMRIIDGEYIHDDQLDFSPVGMVVDEDGAMVVWSREQILVKHPEGQTLFVAIPNTSVVTFGPDAGSIGVGTTDGDFHSVDTRSGGIWGSTNLGKPITGVAWCNQQYWLVGFGNQVVGLQGDAQANTMSLDIGGIVNRIACSEDGAILCVVTNESHIRVYELLNKTHAGDIWFQRTVHGIHFGPTSWLAIGLDDGEANRVELFSGKMTRTMAHPGRQQGSWAMQVEVNEGKLRGASASIRAGGAPIAFQVQTESMEQRKTRTWLYVVLVVVLLFLFCGCFGTVTGIAFFEFDDVRRFVL